ncbi:hypothetical protein KQI42_20280 [Tissierella sp. MSJ-40]|uniref:Uncharacterized protein n=1 Tax=Tissierella simiarum TaxID=2841534 RepID=A0ABS6EC30_9FIRM|nr:hypothetical protein [Tissierella simiarum]MBU5440337.1 hypothetical protein [Tissierella simiarum]
MKKKMRFMLLMVMCLVLLGGTMTAFAYNTCCDNMYVSTRYERGNPGTWIIKYCTNCGTVHSRRWVPEEMN